MRHHARAILIVALVAALSGPVAPVSAADSAPPADSGDARERVAAPETMGTVAGLDADGAAALGSTPADAADDWIWPVPDPHTVVTGFRAPAHRYAAGHRGIDVATSAGDAVSAVADGRVRFVGRVVDRSLVSLELDGGVIVSIEPVDSSLEKDARVHAGEVIGTVASGGHCGSSCVHVGARQHGEYVSPLHFLGGIRRAILLPLTS